jgi:diacylglycerol kinase (ATP)
VRRALLIYNPTAGRRGQRARLGALTAALAAGGWRAEAAPTAAPGEATRLALDAAAGGAEAVFVFGGDGTVREAAAGLLGTAVPLGVLPGGTANVLAHALGLPPAPLAAARALATAVARPFDVGRCGATPFLMMASAGFDSHLLAHLDLRWKARWGKVGIALQALAELRRYRPPPLELTVDGAERAATFVAVQNIPYYGGRFALAPGARWDDRRLDLVTFTGSGRAALAGFALALARGRHLKRSDVRLEPAGEVVILGPPGTSIQVDGDLCTEPLPARIALAAERLEVLVPAAAY